MPSLQEELQALTVNGLTSIARANKDKVQGYSRLRKQELIDLLIKELSSSTLRTSIRKSPKRKRSPKRKLAKTKAPKTGDCISRSKVKLKPHQTSVARYFSDHRGLVAAFETGSGKTLTAIAASQCVLDQAEAEGKDIQVIVITPKTLRENFKKEMVKYGLEPDDPNYTLYTSTQFYYASKRGEIDCSNTFLIVDEAHNMKKFITAKVLKQYMRSRVASTIALSVIDCALRAWKVLLLTATPVPNRAFDILNLVAIVRGELPLKKGELDYLMSDDAAFKRYFKCLFSFYSPEKSEDYPRVINVQHGKVEIEMSPKYYKEYMKLERMKDVDVNPWTFYVGLRQGSNMIKECIKCDYVMDIIDRGEKTLIYSAFKSKGDDILERRLKENKIPFLVISGNVKEKQRKVNVEAFNDPEGPKVLFITKAGAEGLDLVGVRHVIIFESVWNVNAENQIIGRAARYKSHSHLPPSKQNIRVHKLVIVKPKSRRDKDEHPSADVILRELAKAKRKETDDLIERLKQVSIENMEC